jgi:hypothetical protein
MQYLRCRGKPYLVFGKKKPGQLQIWLRLFNGSSAFSTISTALGLSGLDDAIKVQARCSDSNLRP